MVKRRRCSQNGVENQSYQGIQRLRYNQNTSVKRIETASVSDRSSGRLGGVNSEHLNNRLHATGNTQRKIASSQISSGRMTYEITVRSIERTQYERGDFNVTPAN